MESSHFLAVSSPCSTLQKCCLRFLIRPPNAQNLLPKICTKSPISRLVWQIDWRCLGLPGGFRGWSIQWNHAKCCGPTIVAMAMKFGLDAEIQSPTGLFYMFLLLLPSPVMPIHTADADASRHRCCVLNSQLVHSRFGRKIKN